MKSSGSGKNYLDARKPLTVQIFNLGNFVFDRQIQNGTDETIIANLKLEGKRLEEIEIIPVKIIKCQPIIARDNEAEYILNRLIMYSEGMNTNIQIKEGVGYINNKQ